MTKQIETATVVGTITQSGNAKVTVTALYMNNSPKVFSVAVTNGNAASDVGLAIRLALAFDADVSSEFLVSGAGANVILTEHTDKANDTTLNIAIDNDTCLGLTAAPTSTNTLAGSGLDRAYITLQEYKDYQNITSDDTTDDGYIVSAINAASRWIDREATTNFYGASETHKFNIPASYGFNPYPAMLQFDKYLISLTTLTNGDASVITSAQYYLEPANSTPKYGVCIFPTAGISWQANSAGETIQVISVAGVWGYATTAPDDVKEACKAIASALYSRRFGKNGGMKTIITGAGVVQVPEGVPDFAAQIIGFYRRVMN